MNRGRSCTVSKIQAIITSTVSSAYEILDNPSASVCYVAIRRAVFNFHLCIIFRHDVRGTEADEVPSYFRLKTISKQVHAWQSRLLPELFCFYNRPPTQNWLTFGQCTNVSCVWPSTPRIAKRSAGVSFSRLTCSNEMAISQSFALSMSSETWW